MAANLRWLDRYHNARMHAISGLPIGGPSEPMKFSAASLASGRALIGQRILCHADCDGYMKQMIYTLYSESLVARFAGSRGPDSQLTLKPGCVAGIRTGMKVGLG